MTESVMSYSKAEFAAKHEEAIRLFKTGLGYKAVATALQVKPYTVRDWARNWRNRVRADSAAKPADRKRAIAMRRQGASLMEISAQLRISKRTILSWLSADRKAQEEDGQQPNFD